MPQWIAVLADVHVGEERVHAVRHARAAEMLLHAAVEQIGGTPAERVILLGDIVNQGWSSEYATAQEILSPISGMLEPVVGNHELQRGNMADWRREWGVEPVREMEAWGMPGILLNSAIEDLPDDRWNGRLDDGQMGRLEEFLARNRSSGVVIFCHHPIAGTVRTSEVPMLGLDNSDAVRQRLTRHGKQVLFVSGHTHAQSIVRAENLICVGAPSLCYWPHAFLVGERLGDELRLSTVRVREDEYTPDARAVGADMEAYRANNEGTAEDWRGIIKLV